MEDPDLAEEEESGKLSWIVRKGLSVGKKVLVTGFVISSAPLVLPPLVVISVIGFACSVPSGLFLASYVCTDKLMSKLLPGSTPPRFFLDCGTQYGHEEVENNGEGVGLEGLTDMGLLEKIREGMTDYGVEEKQSLEKLSGVTEEGDRKVEEIGMMPSENKNDYGNVRIEKPLREIEHKIEDKIDEPKGSSIGSVDVVLEERRPIEPNEGLLGKRDGDNILEAEKSKGVIGGTTDASSASKKPKVEKLYVLEEGTANENITNNVQDCQLNKEKEFVISTNDNMNDASQQYSCADRDTVEGEYECSGNDRISSQKDLGMAINEAMYEEKKIWQQIDAMRIIMGYKAAKQVTCFEELKVLYIFTGVQPPASFKDPSDLLEINAKLRFLMSVIGVK